MSKSNPHERDLSQDSHTSLLELMQKVGTMDERIIKIEKRTKTIEKTLNTILLLLQQTTRNLLPVNESKGFGSDVINNNNATISETQIGGKRHRSKQDDEKILQAKKKTKVCNL